MNLANLLLRSARTRPQADALVLGDRVLSDYAGFARRCAALARQLRERFALAEGERVALFARNCPQFLECLYAVWWAGLVAVPINNKLHPQEARYILDDSGARLVFATSELAEALGAAGDGGRTLIDLEGPGYEALPSGETLPIVRREGDDLAWLFYTSGTTGKPKGVMLSHANLLTMSLCYFSDVDPIGATDSILYAAPMSHGAGLYSIAHVLAGARHLVPESGGFDAAEVLALARHCDDISMFAAPTMVRRLVDRCALGGDAPGGIRTVVYGGGPMYVEDILRARDVMGDRFVQIYGQGESPMTITALSRAHLGDTGHPRYLERIGSVGVAQSAVEVRIVDPDGHDLAIGEVGEIAVRGATVMRGYWKRPDATAETLRDGWLHTGDMGVFDEDGFLTLKDRCRDLIISGGSNIYPREVEEALLAHPSVAEVSVVGRVSAEWGEEVVAFVVTAPDARFDPRELDAHCRSLIARFKRPKAYFSIDALPKNNYGKVLKTALRDRLIV